MSCPASMLGDTETQRSLWHSLMYGGGACRHQRLQTMADTLSSVSVCLRKSATPSSSSELVSTSLRLRLRLRCQRLIPPAHASYLLRTTIQRPLIDRHRATHQLLCVAIYIPSWKQSVYAGSAFETSMVVPAMHIQRARPDMSTRMTAAKLVWTAASTGEAGGWSWRYR